MTIWVLAFQSWAGNHVTLNKFIFTQNIVKWYNCYKLEFKKLTINLNFHSHKGIHYFTCEILFFLLVYGLKKNKI